MCALLLSAVVFAEAGFIRSSVGGGGRKCFEFSFTESAIIEFDLLYDARSADLDLGYYLTETDGDQVYVGGSFTQIDHIEKLQSSTGSSFISPTVCVHSFSGASGFRLGFTLTGQNFSLVAVEGILRERETDHSFSKAFEHADRIQRTMKK